MVNNLENGDLFAPAQTRRTTTHREIFSKYHLIKPKSDCSYHFPIDFEPNRRPFAVPNLSENGKYNLISV